MGRLDADHRWIPDDGRDRDREVHNAARARWQVMNPNVRPIEAAVGQDSNPLRRTARQLLEITRGVDPVELSFSHNPPDGEDPDDTAARTIEFVDDLATEIDDDVEEIHGRQDDDELFADWIEHALGITVEDYNAAIEKLDEETQAETLEILEGYFQQALAGEDAEGYEDDFAADKAEGEFEDSFQPDAAAALE